MNQRTFLFMLSLLSFTAGNAYSQDEEAPEFPSTLFGTYVASTPCSQGTLPLPGMSAGTGCELMKWTLKLYSEASEPHLPVKFSLHCTYGMSQQGSTGLVGGGKTLEITGTWAVLSTRSAPHLRIVVLYDRKTKKEIISFLKLSDELLHLRDSEGRLMIGNAAWSYTLNRIGKSNTTLL